MTPPSVSKATDVSPTMVARSTLCFFRKWALPESP